MNGRPGVFGIALALLCLGAPAQVQAQCTLTSTPVQFEGTLPNGTKVPSGVPRPILLTAGSSALTVFHNAAGAPRLMNAETFGYSILDLTNPANPTALKYDDFRFDATSSTTNPIPTHGDGQSYIATTAVSKDGQRIAFSMNGPADPPWHTLAGRSDGAEGFGMWGDFPMNRALGTAVQAVAGRYIAYAVSGSANVTAADITSLPTSDFSPLNIPYETSANMPGGYSMLLAGNYLVYTTNAGVLTVVDASNPGPAGRITSAYKSVSIPYLTSDPLLHRAPVNYTAAVDPGDSTKLWLLVEVPKNYPSENSPSYGLVAVTKDGSGNLTATAAPGLIRVPSQAGEIWSNAGNASSLVAQNGFLFVVMWAQRSSPSPQFGFFSTTAYAWPAVSSFTAVSAPNFNLPATSAVSYAGSGNSIYQYFPTGPAAFAIPYSCQPVNVPAVSSLTVTNTSAGTSVSSGDPVFLGDVLTVVPVVGPSPAFNPLTSWSFDFDFHAGNPIEDAVASPRIKNPDNGVFGNPANPPAQAVLTGPCDPTGVPSGDPPTGGSCWTSVLNNGATGGPDFTAAAAAGTTKPLGIAFEARNQYGIANTAVFTVNWVVPAAKIASTHVLSGQPLVSASDGHPLAASYKWYFGNSPTTLAVAPSCTTATCVPTTSPAAGTYYYWLTAAYANGYSTPDYVQGTTAGLPFTITPFIPAFTVNGSATGPVSLQVNQALTVANSSQRGSGVTGSYSYDLCLSPCTATYSGTTGGIFTGMTDPTNTSGTPPSSATLAAPPTAGTYTLRLRISYAGGTSYWPDPAGVGGIAVTVTNPPPPVVVTASATPNPANSGDVIQFSCSATGGSGT
ncbi:MAG TPA: hypothetical protein VMH79_10175, partial [Thermoanaerobaculia bacterium]|nr:hypothetical protein [Thermoanaerobaculia bacterium]